MITTLKAGDDSRFNWRTINEISAQLNANMVPDQQRNAGVAELRRRGRDAGFGLPFEIYQSDTWLKYKVRFGVVITTGEPILTTSGIETEFTLTSGVIRYWFLLTISGGTSAAISTAATVPAWSTSIIPIGWVDTNTYSGTSRGVIYQFTHDNIFVPCAA